MRNYMDLLFEFADDNDAAMASDTLDELGYAPVILDGRPNVHIQLDGGDLTSAIEIAQAHGGKLAVHEIPIPAHMVNEDWVAQEELERRAQEEVLPLANTNTPEPEGLHNRNDDDRKNNLEDPDSGTYDHFSGDVHT
ncbi:hypothetical protein [Paenibacillus nasutitermitis]|uniref:Uncharacterized protein n=1 Tax=Paenibacillus nasutitermitis TaxID=1652958 RepID=A0A916YIP9_9BACL|nr:hypothetical protein [Paenibacillus nasutitermitis]GGD46971.1 hypothetical protein GCM10010911_00600 [Paenibacillus nasutitermitis]